MRTRFLCSMTALLVGASLASAQPWSGAKTSAPSVPSAPAAEAGPAASSIPPPVWTKPDGSCDPVAKDDYMPTSLCENRLWFSAEYLFWWPKSGPVRQPLVTTGTVGSPPGGLDQPDTVVLYANPDISYKPASGGRYTTGYMFDDFRRNSIEAGFFALGGREEHFQISSDSAGNPPLSRPFFSTPPPLFTPGNDVHSVSRPGLFAGTVRVDSDIDFFGVEFNFSHNCLDLGPFTVDALFGMRYIYLFEEINIRDYTVSIGGDLFLNDVFLDNGAGMSDGNAVTTSDSFKVTNHFYGGQVGLRGEYNCDCWYVLGKVKCALGYTSHTVSIDGLSTAILADGTQFSGIGGVLALTPNIGRHTDSSFTVVPEAELSVGFHLTENIRIFAGYSFLYMSKVMRPGEVINGTINPAFLPTADPATFGAPGGPNNPRVLFDKTDFFVHGINAGVAYHW